MTLLLRLCRQRGVLAPFPAEALATVEALVARAADAAETWLAEGSAATMNRFNS